MTASLLDVYRAQARYNLWMNEKIYAACATLDDQARKLDRGAFFGSIHRTLNHILLGDRIWMLRFSGDHERYTSKDAQGAPIAITSLGQELYADFEVLRAERARTDADIVAWFSSIDEALAAGELSYKTTNGTPMRHPAWWSLSHFFNHQTHHRGQVTTLLMQAGVDPGVTDLVAMLREETQGDRR